MEVVRAIITVLFVIISVIFTVTVLMQEGKSAGLGAIGGMADSYWGKNKGHTVEGKLEKISTYGAVLFLVLAIILNLPF